WQQVKPRSRRLSFREETAMSDWTMDRRAFLEHATVSGSVAAVGAVLPGLARGVSRRTAPVVAPFELEEATIAGLQAGLESGKYTARSRRPAHSTPSARLGAARAAARHPGARKGQHRDARSDAEHRRLTGARGGGAPARCLPGGAAAGRGRRAAGKG